MLQTGSRRFDLRSSTPTLFSKHDPVHRSNILNKHFREVGIGVLTGTYKQCTQTMMYTVDFGTRG